MDHTIMFIDEPIFPIHTRLFVQNHCLAFKFPWAGFADDFLLGERHEVDLSCPLLLLPNLLCTLHRFHVYLQNECLLPFPSGSSAFGLEKPSSAWASLPFATEARNKSGIVILWLILDALSRELGEVEIELFFGHLLFRNLFGIILQF